ncbi:MAG TPA: glycosyltransferase, partial [Planctomycetota bacterium]|nr:glycosyltransferase [Planctomycetota bacterium]
MPEPTLSVIVPFHDGADRLRACLSGLASSSAEHELILVDDASSDPAAIELARSSGARYVRLDTNRGPAVARNAGARIASGEILAFVDSDVVVQPDSLAKLRAVLTLEPDVGAVFGSYDAAPASPGMVSRYRNLMHHFYHQTGPREATTFWAGCGAMRRAVFERAGGFDERYRHPSIEDVELGVRLHAAGVPIRLRPDIQCKHLKRWRLLEMVRVDVTRRAIPWTRLMIERPGIGRDLNLAPAQRLCVVLVFLAVALVPAGALAPELRSIAAWLWLPLAALAPVVWINRRLYELFLRRGGAIFALQAFLLHLLYYVYGGLAWGWGQLVHRLGAKERAAAALVALLGAWPAACGG